MINLARANGRLAALLGQPRKCPYGKDTPVIRQDWLSGYDSVAVEKRGTYKGAAA